MSQTDEEFFEEFTNRVFSKLRESPPVVSGEFFRKTFHEDFQRLSELPRRPFQVFAFILRNGPSHLFDIRQVTKIPTRTIYYALERLKRAGMISVDRSERYFVVAKGFVPFAK